MNEKNQSTRYFSHPFGSTSNISNITFIISENQLEPNQIQIIFNCTITAENELNYFLFDNSHLLSYGNIPSEEITNLSIIQNYNQNGKHIFNFIIYDEEGSLVYNNTIPYEIISIKSDIINSVPKDLINIFFVFGIGSAIILPMYSSYIYLKKKGKPQYLAHNSPLFLSENDINIKSSDIFQTSSFSLFGKIPSYYNSILIDNTISSVEKESFILACSNISEIRLFNGDSRKSIFGITPKPHHISNFKQKEIAGIYSLLISKISYSVPIQLKFEQETLEFRKYFYENLICIVLFQFPQHSSSIFDSAISELLSRIALQKINLKTKTKITLQFKSDQILDELMDLINLQIAFPLSSDKEETKSLTKSIPDINDRFIESFDLSSFPTPEKKMLEDDLSSMTKTEFRKIYEILGSLKDLNTDDDQNYS